VPDRIPNRGVSERRARQPSSFPLSADEALWSGALQHRAAFFSRTAPLEVEIGSGKARFLIEAARANPAHDFLGVERSLSYYRICRDRVLASGLTNARVVRADGRLYAEALSPSSVRAFHVYFPDPWPKRKQRKRRLLDGVTLEVLAERLEPGGYLRIATDHPDYGTFLEPVLATVPALERLDWDALTPPPPTHYELKYRQQGRPIWQFLLQKRVTPDT
jgi:tRNA (guanine-N7-)-methyltransferase